MRPKITYNSSLRTKLIKLVARGKMCELRYVYEAFGRSNPYDSEDECELEVTPRIQTELLDDIIKASDDDIEFVDLYLRDEGYIIL